MQKVKDEIKQKINKIVEYKEEYNLISFEKLKKQYAVEKEDKESKISYKERIYNRYLCDKLSADLLDRKTTGSLEIADVYDHKEKNLIHVKIGETGKLVECINQSYRGSDYYNNNKDKVKSKLGVEEVKQITLLFVTNQKRVWKKKDFNEFMSLKLKLGLIEWVDHIQLMGYTPRIIVAKEEEKQ